MSTGPYGGAILVHFRRPRNYGPLPDASAEAEGTNPLCGDRVRVWIALDETGQRISEARFTANACAICVAAASMLTERLRGMSRSAAAEIPDDDIVAMLGGEIPPARRRCATLALEAARRALEAHDANSRPADRRGPQVRSVVGVVLAAGKSQRFGAQKLLAEVAVGERQRRSLVRLAAVLLLRSGVDRVVVVVGREGDRVRERLAGLELEVVGNDAYAEGMSTSLRAGVGAALEHWPDAAGMLIALGDQPLIDDRIVPRLVEVFEQDAGARIVAPRYRGVRGNPAVFGRALASELLAITGDRGAREVIEREAGRVTYVDFDFDAPVDVDTQDDLMTLAATLGVEAEANGSR